MKIVKRISTSMIVIFIFTTGLSFAQNKVPVYVDDSGEMRWTKDYSSVALFGVNYTVPFAHAYRVHEYMGVGHKKAIEQDIYHMVRLGLNAFRVHVWDCEISDTLGNLIENEHLDLLDYQCKLMKDRGIKLFITPIAYWGNGYPERSENTPGFSNKYGKEDCLVNEDAIKAQENYLEQFVNHVNPYTKLAYKNDPDIIAFEICNEPHHKGTPEQVTGFINKMSTAIRKTGCEKVIFYNASHNVYLSEAYAKANIQGGTFQWYPTGLVRNMEIKGNFLPNMNTYDIPFGNTENFKKLARIVYEFDPADVGRSYTYPYIAKSFREAGMQFATQFAYDPLYMAPFNTEYQTHYMNLVYAPQKALSLKIAGEVFRTTELWKDYGAYPEDTVFADFRVSYKNDLAVMNADEKYFYTNHISTSPVNINKLKHIAGYGNSPVVKYSGTGAYFLDKLEKGVWRLEVMPDAVWIHDPYSKGNLKRKVSVILYNQHNLTINLPELEEDFSFRGINANNKLTGVSRGASLDIAPGVYILENKKSKSSWKGNEKWKNIVLNEYVSPPSNCDKLALLHQPPFEISVQNSFSLKATVVSPDTIESIKVYLFNERGRPEIITMEKKSTFEYIAEIDSSLLHVGFLKYFISVSSGGKQITYPMAENVSPEDWYFNNEKGYEISIVDSKMPVCLFDANRDAHKVYGNTEYQIVPSQRAGEKVLIIKNSPGNKEIDEHAVRFYLGDKIQGRRSDLSNFSTIEIEGYAKGENKTMQLAFVLDNGNAFATIVNFKEENSKQEFNLAELKNVPLILLPAAYPTFLPTYYKGCGQCEFNIEDIESIQFSLLPGQYTNENNKILKEVFIQKVVLKQNRFK